MKIQGSYSNLFSLFFLPKTTVTDSSIERHSGPKALPEHNCAMSLQNLKFPSLLGYNPTSTALHYQKKKERPSRVAFFTSNGDNCGWAQQTKVPDSFGTTRGSQTWPRNLGRSLLLCLSTICTHFAANQDRKIITNWQNHEHFLFMSIKEKNCPVALLNWLEMALVSLRHLARFWGNLWAVLNGRKLTGARRGAIPRQAYTHCATALSSYAACLLAPNPTWQRTTTTPSSV